VLTLDAWLASSLLQKAIRRSDSTTAIGAALAFYRARGPAIWRRFQIIAAEDVGIGSLEAVTAAASGAEPEWRAQVGGDQSAIIQITQLLAEAPKDRSAEHLIRLCRDFSGYEKARDLVGTATAGQRLQWVGAADAQLHLRAIAAWFASGLNSSSERRLTGGDLPGVLDALRGAGVPEQLVITTGSAARKTRDPMCLMPALVWLEALKDGQAPAITRDSFLSSPLIGDIPCYALDKFTANGKTAIRIFARENDGVRAVLEAYVADYRAHDAAAMAVFYVEGGCVALRCDWHGSRALEGLGTEQDLAGVGVAPDGIALLLDTVRANVGELHEIRARVHKPKRGAA
jgi:hypothetical protein